MLVKWIVADPSFVLVGSLCVSCVIFTQHVGASFSHPLAFPSLTLISRRQANLWTFFPRRPLLVPLPSGCTLTSYPTMEQWTSTLLVSCPRAAYITSLPALGQWSPTLLVTLIQADSTYYLLLLMSDWTHINRPALGCNPVKDLISST